MPGAPEDDRESVDRAFADLVAGYHLTSDRPDPLADPAGAEPLAAESRPAAPVLDTSWSDAHPLFRLDEPLTVDEAPAEVEERFVPAPPPPLTKPAWPVLVAWIGMGYSILVVLAVVLGANLPNWAGWLAVLGFVGAFAVLVARLPRHRPPEAGDGAVL